MLGVSPDDAASHRKFKAKYSLRLRLLVDEDHEIAEAYGVWAQKKNFGHKYMGVVRTTFIVDPKGRVAHVFEKVSPAGHAAEVAAVLDDLKGS